VAREGLGDKYGPRMLGKFAYDRDYDKAEEIAKHLAKNFPDTRFHRAATRLVEELPKRRDDFGKLKLPTPKEWAEQKKAMTRAEQIDYLCKRLRLLNSPPSGPTPITPDPAHRQYPEPINTWDDLRKGKTEVINPLVELGDRMDLKASDVEYLAPHLKDDWLMLVLYYTRLNGPSGTLHTSRPLIAELINAAAKRELCDPAAFGKLTDEEKDKKIRRLIDWAKRNAGKGDN
jgi:hypothetical protein